MSSQCFIMNVEPGAQAHTSDAKPAVKDKLMSYEEKSVGSTAFFKCEACPYMALAEDDIKFHLFTAHPDLAKSNGLADNIQINCPGCSSIFDAEETLRNHLRNHHKMGIKDVKKMVKSLVQLALKNAKLKKEDITSQSTPQEADVKIPQVIEIVPDIVNANNESLPQGVAFISVDELQKMSTPNFEKVDPKEIIQEASINIVYTNPISTQYVNVTNAVTPVTACNVLQVSSVTPDLISSIQPRKPIDNNINQSIDNTDPVNRLGKLAKLMCKPLNTATDKTEEKIDLETMLERDKQLICSVNNCRFRVKSLEKLAYHRKCHLNKKFQCPECAMVFLDTEAIHTHLWKTHEIDMEMPTCEICGFKTYKRARYNQHIKCHGKVKAYACTICQKSFKTANQLSKHKTFHKEDPQYKCSICPQRFLTKRRLKLHVSAVHEKLRPFKCCHCDYTASRKDEMKVHLRSHTGDKPYSCDQCSYRAADHNAMRRHKKVHTKEVAYKCKHCPFSTIQSNNFASHMISMHPNVTSTDLHRCPYCVFKTVSKDLYLTHLTTHTDKEGVQLLIEMTKSKKLAWTVPSETTEKVEETAKVNEESKEQSPKPVNDIPIEVYDCDSLSETLSQNFSKNYANSANEKQQSNFDSQVIVTDLSKDDNNSDCLISESSSDTLMDRQYTTQHTLQNLTYDATQGNLHYLNTPVPIEQTLCPNSTVNSLVSNHSVISNMSNNIMANFPIRLPPAQLSMQNITLNPLHKISLPMTKVTGPIIKPTQILPVPSSSNSPVNLIEPDGMPRKKPKISVKSNLILKGPDQENMFHSQQKMAFKRLEDNERFGLGAVTFNNLITTQFMQLQPEPELSESPNNIIPYPQETLLHAASTPPVDNVDNSQMFTFNNQMNVNSIILPPPQKIQNNDPSYIKIEATIKQNTQSPSLERMCNANIMSNQSLSREYKASPPLEDIHKNFKVIKNEVKSDAFYNMAMNNTTTNPSIIDQYLIDNIIGEQYPGHLDLSAAALDVSDPQNDVIEIDDNSDDNKLLSRYDMNFPLESLYLMHNDFHFLENDVPSVPNEVTEINRIVTEVPILNQKEISHTSEGSSNDYPNFIQGKKDPMMNTSVRQSVNKINVKNIELMKDKCKEY
ncbi:RE1-silencing transcription factor-like [Cydia strobilella]|uniref:RE1-silencing transcription factor-like n=1 Tax=Cydia strobilella TaxID=1100964 RepID=UPI0030049351